MVRRNPNLIKLHGAYLFPEIEKRKMAYLASHPDAKLISLGIGDTTQPIPKPIAMAMSAAALELSTHEGYKGYGPPYGYPFLREKIAKTLYPGMIETDEVFISDGAKPDTFRLQALFGSPLKIAIQDPSYPVYVDVNVISGNSQTYDNQKQQYTGIIYLPCTPENNFFPTPENLAGADLIYLCYPNNPTGAVASKSQLQLLVDSALNNQAVILYDAAYSFYIQDPDIPRSIYEIPGAEKVAIEIGSFSKMAGFTGVRLGWTIIPKALTFQDGSSVNKDWMRILSTTFNAASYLSQVGGAAALEPEGLKAMNELISFYMENTHHLRECCKNMGFEVHGGLHTPFIWTRVPGKTSWQAFEDLLEQTQIITTPGSGFGPSGEGFIRLSAFNNRSEINDALQRLSTGYAK